MDRYEINLGMGHTHNNTSVPGTTVHRVGAPYQLPELYRPLAATVPGYENPDQHINISGDELCCIITHEPFTEGQRVSQCNQCHKRVGAEAMEQWHGSCPNCRGPFGPATFRKGKAHLPEAAAATAPTHAPS